MAGILKFVEKVCVQTAVYWGNPQADGYGGNTFQTGVEIKVRWDDKTEKIINKYGEETVSKAVVMTPEDKDDGGFLYLGTLASLTVEQRANPKLVSTAYPIQTIERTPLFKSSSKFVYVIYL